MTIVQVILPVPLFSSFDYLLPEGCAMPTIGCRVVVPFGKQRRSIGIVKGFSSHSEFPIEKLKPIEEVLDTETLFPGILWDMLNWASAYYHYPLGEVLFHAMPILLRQGKPAEFTPLWQWYATQEGEALDLNSLKSAKKQQQALAALRRAPLYRHQLDEYEITTATLNNLKRKH